MTTVHAVPMMPGAGAAMRKTFHVEALWDAEAKVWVSRGDVPGLVIEAATLADFEGLMQALAPGLLADDGGCVEGGAFGWTVGGVVGVRAV